MIDIVTVVFREELEVLKLQAQSIDLYCNNMCLHTIQVVINDDTLSKSDIDPAWWGKYSSRVQIKHRQEWNINYFDNGWLTQQLLKLLASAQSNSRWSMVLDAKTIFVQSAELDRLFDDDGKITWGYCPIFPVFEPAKRIVSDLFKLDHCEVAGPAGVPFLFHKSTVAKMIQTIEDQTKQDFASWFQEQGMVTEFILYSGYIQFRDGSLDEMYTKTFAQPYMCCNVSHNETGMFDIKFSEMAEKNNLTVSIHRGAWAKLTDKQKQDYCNLLIERGITSAKDLV